jgi:hypothetical protein
MSAGYPCGNNVTKSAEVKLFMVETRKSLTLSETQGYGVTKSIQQAKVHQSFSPDDLFGCPNITVSARHTGENHNLAFLCRFG